MATLTVVVTRDVEDRYRGFLASAMLEVAPGVYVSPHLTPRAREKIWDVLADWHARLGRGGITMIHPERQADGGLRVRNLGHSPRSLVAIDGALLTALSTNPK